MNLLSKVFKAVLSTTSPVQANGMDPASGSGRINRLCQEVGWVIHERNADLATLYFSDPIVRRRKITVSEGSSLIQISTFSGSLVPSSRVPIEVLGYLLTRNAGLLACAWQVSVMDKNGNVSFALAYTALAAGLTAVAFKMICETMVKEAHEFDVKMRAVGLL